MISQYIDNLIITLWELSQHCCYQILLFKGIYSSRSDYKYVCGRDRIIDYAGVLPGLRHREFLFSRREETKVLLNAQLGILACAVSVLLEVAGMCVGVVQV